MSSWNWGDNAPYTARDALKRFQARNVTLPDTITAAAANLERVTSARPAKPPVDTIRNLIVSGAPQSDIDAAVLADLAHSRLLSEYAQAEVLAAHQVLKTFRDAHDTLFQALEEQALALIKHVEQVAALGEGVTLDALVRDGNIEDAAALASIDQIVAELNELYEVRYYLVKRGYLAMRHEDGTDCCVWQDPRPVNREARGNDNQTQKYLRGIRSGGTLWYPNAQSARDAAEPIAAEERRTAEKIAQKRREQNASAGAFA